MKVAIIKYNAGNTQSVIFALNRLGVNPLLTNQVEELSTADRVIFPGVGEAQSTMNHLRELGLDHLIPQLKQPVLGICLGMQLLCGHSQENDTDCLGVFDLEVKRFKAEKSEKIPHMGWNTAHSQHQLFTNLGDDHMYFVHSYYVPVSEYTIAETNYIHPFSAAIQKDNFWAVQFHPEKSGEQGQSLLKNFLSK